MEKLSIIREEITNELSKAGIIDKSGKIINHQAFLEFIDRKLQEKSKELASTEKDGVTVDLYHANMVYSEISYLEEMKKQMSVDPYKFVPEETNDTKAENFGKGQEKVQKKSDGLFANLKMKFSKMFGRNK